MNLHNDDEHEHHHETADLPPLPLVPVPRPGNEGKSRLPPPSDKLVFGPVARSDVSPAPPEPLVSSDPAG
ncbi:MULTISPECIES: hypothetical protein [unclassified Nonomuraea]|uniref:hypothetical protein n=1 Tax=unclassified Nonomuraea TaxID=2593643 RepID=UPI0035C22C00